MLKKKEIENKIKQTFTQITPNVFDSVLSDCKKQKGRVIVMTDKQKLAPWKKSIIGIAAALVILIGGAFSIQAYRAQHAVASTVSLDVNPSIEIKVNQKEQVLEVNAKNEDAQIVIGNMDFSGSTLDLTVNAIIGSMLRNGYLSDIANSILISVDNNNTAKAAELQKKLTDEINQLFQNNTFSGAILSQSISPNAELQTLADTYQITLGKANLIQQIVNQNPLYNFEDLVSLSINELNLLSNSAQTNLENVDSVGTASDKAYSGIEKAKEIAFQHAGISASDATNLEIELDYDKGVMLYEIEFNSGSIEFEYDIHAVTGEVLKYSSNDKQSAPSQGTDTIISEAEAKEIALTHASVTESSIQNYQIKLERDDGRQIYDIEFYAGNNKYSYDINAADGTIVKYDKEIISSQTGSQGGTSSSTYIGEAKAQEIALAHAGVTIDNIYGYQVEFERDDGVYLYEIEFYSDYTEYSYEINALTGSILKYDKEFEDDHHHIQTTAPAATSAPSPSSSPSSYIGEAKAQEIALADAGVSSSDIRGYKVELDRDDGIVVYEIEFHSGRVEYSYEINASTGSIVKSDREIDD